MSGREVAMCDSQDIITRKRDYHLGNTEDTLIAHTRLGRKIGSTQLLDFL